MAKSGVGGGYNLHPHGTGIPVPGGHHRLVQPVCALMEAFQYPDAGFCVEALEEALRKGKPDIFNTDQGAQFTGEAFTLSLIHI